MAPAPATARCNGAVPIFKLASSWQPHKLADETGAHGHYCPITIGAAYGDGAFGDEVQFSRIKTPLLLIPFVAIRITKSRLR